MKYSWKSILLVLIITISALSLWQLTRPKTIILRLGIYTRSSWDVPNDQSYKVIDKAIAQFEKAHPNVKVVYESGIPKDNYQDWLSDQIVQGQQPDVYILPENDFNILVSNGALKNLDSLIDKDMDPSVYYPVAYEAGSYKGSQYALPYETNLMMMCINNDILAQEGIALPESDWTIADFYAICQQVTRDTDGDGSLDQYGIVDYSWQEAMAAYGTSVFNDSGTKSHFTTNDTKEAMNLIVDLQELSQHHQLTSKDFDEGKVAFRPMTLAEYRTYKPYPYHVSKYSSFTWTCIKMPAVNQKINATQVNTSLYGISSKTRQTDLAWEFLKLLSVDQNIQQELFNSSQGASVLKSVMTSQETVSILKQDDFGSDALSVLTLDSMLKHAKTPPKFRQYNQVLERADYLVTEAIANDRIDRDMIQIQKEIDAQLK